MEVKDIKDKIKNLELKSANAKGKMDLILDKFKNTYGCDDVESAKKLLEQKKAENEEKQKLKTSLVEKLQSMRDWKVL